MLIVSTNKPEHKQVTDATVCWELIWFSIVCHYPGHRNHKYIYHLWSCDWWSKNVPSDFTIRNKSCVYFLKSLGYFLVVWHNNSDYDVTSERTNSLVCLRMIRPGGWLFFRHKDIPYDVSVSKECGYYVVNRWLFTPWFDWNNLLYSISVRFRQIGSSGILVSSL